MDVKSWGEKEEATQYKVGRFLKLSTFESLLFSKHSAGCFLPIDYILYIFDILVWVIDMESDKEIFSFLRVRLNIFLARL